MASSMTTELQ
uniref:Uncharacterized protein n=1 Tax=Arundo donax TaxID=35708 RepID=A0A0A8ZT84_ARUDO